MSNIAIRAEQLGKMYYIGGPNEAYRTLREVLVRSVTGPLRRIRHPGSTTHNVEPLWALRDVSFEVGHGEVLGVIGANGAGKSTLLKLLSRVTDPTKGRAEIHGRVGSLLEVGTGFHPELTGRENIYLNGAILGMRRTEIETKFDEIVAFSEIERFLDTPVKRYSSGMYVRLAFAVAAHLDPEVLLVDEVLAVGDAAFQKKCLGKMEEVAREGRTILLVSHNLSYINHVCRRAVLLSEGRVVADGDSASVVEQYMRISRASAGSSTLAYETSERLVSDGISIRAVEILSASGNRLEAVGGGECIRIRIHYSCYRPIKSPSFVVTLSTLVGVEVIRLSTLPISGHPLPDLTGNGYVDCVVERLDLTGGTYVLGVGIGRPNVEYMIFDSSIGSFDIAPYDAYGSGFGLDRRCGLAVLPHHWELVGE